VRAETGAIASDRRTLPHDRKSLMSSPARPSEGPETCTVQFIGTATMILRLGPFTLLTDPNFLHRGQRAYLGYGLSSKRLVAPAVTIEQLPELDAVVLSHMHGDHWDRVAKRGLPHQLPVLTTPKAARALHRQGFRAAEALPTWSSSTLTKAAATLTVTALPGRHATGPARHLLPPVMGSMLEFRAGAGADGRAVRIYITGDTLLIDELRAIPTRYPDIDVAILHLGGTTLPGGLVVTMDGVDGADLVELVRPDAAVPIHYDDYGVFKSPLVDFQDEMTRRGLAEKVLLAPRGATTDLLDLSAP
jgi:L-ascorbate metabolism protein UlaG (beta-lactamase superfamily)